MNILKIYKQKLRFKNYSERTIKVYSHYLLEYFNMQKIADPYQVTTANIINYLENRSYTSVAQQNQIIGALKLFAKYILGKKQLHLNKIERPKKEKKLPLVLDGNEIASKIKNILNLKHKAILALGLSCGLRVSEVINLQWSDLDRSRNLIHIKNAKGGKDRVVFLNNTIIQLLADYWRAYKSVKYVFNGQFSAQYTASSCQKLVKKYINKQATYHVLRHTYATFAHENGTDIATISKTLGHSSVKTTMIYTRVATSTIKNIKQAI